MKKAHIVSPAAVVLLYPALFSDQPLLGGYQPPCGGRRAKHDDIALTLIVATYLYLYESGEVRLKLKREGMEAGEDRVYVYPVSPRVWEVSYLTRKLKNVFKNEGERVSRVVRGDVKVASPAKHFIEKVFENDVEQLFSTNGVIDCEAVKRYAEAAKSVKRMLDRYRENNRRLYRALVEEAKKALRDVQERGREAGKGF